MNGHGSFASINLVECSRSARFASASLIQCSQSKHASKKFLKSCFQARDILIWFIELYYEFSVVEQIALRQIFFYGKYIATKNRRVNTNWFSNHVIPLIKTY